MPGEARQIEGAKRSSHCLLRGTETCGSSQFKSCLGIQLSGIRAICPALLSLDFIVSVKMLDFSITSRSEVKLRENFSFEKKKSYCFHFSFTSFEKLRIFQHSIIKCSIEIIINHEGMHFMANTSIYLWSFVWVIIFKCCGATCINSVNIFNFNCS